MWMTASNELIFFVVWPLPETAMGVRCNCLVVVALPCTHYVIRSFPLWGVNVLHPHTNHGCLGYPVLGAFHDVVAT